MRGLWNSIVGKLTGGAVHLDYGLEAHFAALNKAEAGLARKVAAFVTDDSGRAVLSTLSMAAVRAAWSGQARSYPRKTPVVGLLGANADAMLVRFGEAMAILEPAPSNSHWGAFGTKAAPDWLRHAVSSGNENMHGTPQPLCSIDQLVRIAELGGASTGAVIDILFHPGPGVPYGTQHSIARFAGTAEWLRDNPARIIAEQKSLDAPGRVELAHALGRSDLVEPYLGLLVDYGLSMAKTVRAAAMKALTAAPPDALSEALDARHAGANAGVRTELVSLALGALGTDVRPLLDRWRESEEDKRPRDALDRALANVALGDGPTPQAGGDSRSYVALDGSTVMLPDRAPLPEATTIPDSVYALLQSSIASYNERVLALREEHRADKNHWSRSWALIGSDGLVEFRHAAEGGTASKREHHARNGIHVLNWSDSFIKWDRSGVAAFYAHPAVTVRHLIALLRWNSRPELIWMLRDDMGHHAAQELRRRIRTPADMMAVIDLWTSLGGAPPALEYLAMSWGASLAHVDAELFWPHVAENFDAIDEALGLRPQSRQPALHAGNALDLLALLPKVPHRYLLPLMTIATGTQKAARQQARALLAGAPDIDTAIAGLLGDGKQDMRAGAAEWLAARGARAAVPALRTALAKEKSDVARAAIITALERLGDDVADCFDRDRLLAEAGKGIAKTPAKGLEWFPFDLLPPIAWQDGQAVDPRILRWWVVLAHKLKQPGSNALLDLWITRLAPADAKRLGLFVLRAWIDHDTRQPTEEEGNAHALAHVDQQLVQRRQTVQRYPDILKSYPLYADHDALFAELKRTKMAQYMGSGSDSKGVLALAAQAEGADAAAAVRTYLKDHGARVSQAKALLEVLAANPAPAAIQVVLAAANRFKARTVQDHAAALIERIADHRGWTPEELADRTIPTAGLDEHGTAEVDCGEGRTYRLRLDADDALVLLNPSGQPTKSLPAARNDEEKPVVAAAKKQLANARKELKQAIAAQGDRLYEAMCLERRWPAADWDRYLLRHPIVGRLLRRIVWIGLDSEGHRLASFRPLDDGSLSDVEDGDVALDAIAQVQIAHASLVTADEADGWRAHLADYEIESPFAQFDLDLPELPETQRNATTIEDRKGWMIETFKLRGIATKLGFVRGGAGDGGVFTTYQRRYEAAGLVALIEFTGSPLPEENIPAALQDLRFARLRRNDWYGAGIPLGEVPPVLLAESRKTLHRIAAAGTGFDPAWEKKSGW